MIWNRITFPREKSLELSTRSEKHPRNTRGNAKTENVYLFYLVSYFSTCFFLSRSLSLPPPPLSLSLSFALSLFQSLFIYVS